MNPQLRDSFDMAAVPAEALAKWNGDPQTMELVGQSQNFVFRFRERQSGQGRILRITHAGHRSPLDIAAELEFLVYLKSRGLGVATALPSVEGTLLENVGQVEGEYQAAVFEEITGERHKWGNDQANRRSLSNLGRWVGKLHRYSMEFQPRQTTRFHWFEDSLYKDPERYLPESEPALRNELSELIKWLNARPATPQNYGLIHGDLGPANYRLQGEKITAFDFDDCDYHWFAFDIAVAILPIRKLSREFRRPYLQQFLYGYTREKELTGDTCKEIGWFSRLSAMNRLIFAMRSSAEDPTPDQQQQIEKRRQEVLHPIDWC